MLSTVPPHIKHRESDLFIYLHSWWIHHLGLQLYVLMFLKHCVDVDTDVTIFFFSEKGWVKMSRFGPFHFIFDFP
jgi:hypothetical protein